MLRAAVVGCGRIGCGFDDDPKRKHIATHAGTYFASDNVELVALADLDSEKLRKYGAKYNIPTHSLYEDYAGMLKEERPEILSICTWSPTHLEIVEEALKCGVRAIFCEKPIADDLKSARRMVDLCRENEVILMVDHQRRFDGFHQEVKKFIEDGRLGQIQQAHVYYTAGIANTGSHVFDLLRFFFGDADYVQAVNSRAGSPNPEDPNLDGVVMFKTGPLCMVQACDVKNYLILEFDILGASGRIKLIHSGFDIEFYEVRESLMYSGYREIFPARSPIDPSGPKRFMENAVEHLVGCMENKTQPISSGADGLAALELICAFHESASKGGTTVSLPIEKSEITINSR